VTHPPVVTLVAGRYRLDDHAASGRFAEVWRGTDVILARPVAVKLLREEFAGQPGALAWLRDEARHAGSVVHENIVRIYDYDEPAPPGQPFVVMEFVDGPSLAEVLAGGPLEPGRVMDLVAQVAAGLQAAHQAGLVDGAISPDHILVSRDGLVKLTHFAVPADGGGSAASDLYALGAVADQCLAGAPPSTVPADVTALVGEHDAENPADRPATAGHVAERAVELRDRLDPGPAALPPDPATPGPVPSADRESPARPVRPGSRARYGRHALAAAVVVGTALTAWALVTIIGPVAQHPSAGLPPGTTMVNVSGARLIGRTVQAARRELHHLGLLVSVRWRSTGQAPTGIVLAVRPTGPVPSGSVIVLVAARYRAVASSGPAQPAGGHARPSHQHLRPGRPHQPGPSPAGHPQPAPGASATPSPSPTASPSPSASPTPTGSPSPTATPGPAPGSP